MKTLRCTITISVLGLFGFLGEVCLLMEFLINHTIITHVSGENVGLEKKNV
jgi:hypothetical protein